MGMKAAKNSLDLGIIGGAGVEISRFLVEARMNWGIKNVAKASGGGVMLHDGDFWDSLLQATRIPTKPESL